jgi:hypothetical protein
VAREQRQAAVRCASGGGSESDGSDEETVIMVDVSTGDEGEEEG